MVARGEKGELSLARDALVTSAILLHSVEENVMLLSSIPDVAKAWSSLLLDYLPNCGDAPIQVPLCAAAVIMFGLLYCRIPVLLLSLFGLLLDL